jgi:hypothetical protein
VDGTLIAWLVNMLLHRFVRNRSWSDLRGRLA